MIGVPFCTCAGCPACQNALNSVRQERNDTRIERDAAVNRAARAEAEVLRLQRQVEQLTASRDRLLARTFDIKAAHKDATEILQHEAAHKLGLVIDTPRARDIAAQIVQVMAGHAEGAGYIADESEAA